MQDNAKMAQRNQHLLILHSKGGKKGDTMKLCGICHKNPARYKYCEPCAKEIRRLQNAGHRRSRKIARGKIGAQGQRKKPMAESSKLKLRWCLRCEKTFESDGLFICAPCTIANSNIWEG